MVKSYIFYKNAVHLLFILSKKDILFYLFCVFNIETRVCFSYGNAHLNILSKLLTQCHVCVCLYYIATRQSYALGMRLMKFNINCIAVTGYDSLYYGVYTTKS